MCPNAFEVKQLMTPDSVINRLQWQGAQTCNFQSEHQVMLGYSNL